MEPTCRHHNKRLIKKLIKIQNKYLQVIARIYKTISIIIFEIKIYISSLNLYLNIRLTGFCHYHKKSEIEDIVKKACKKIQY